MGSTAERWRPTSKQQRQRLTHACRRQKESERRESNRYVTDGCRCGSEWNRLTIVGRRK